MPMENRAFRAVSWGRCRATWVRCRTEGVLWAVVAVSGQAGAGNGAGGSAGRGHGQEAAAGQHVDPRPETGVLQPEPAPQDTCRGPQVFQHRHRTDEPAPGRSAGPQVTAPR